VVHGRIACAKKLGPNRLEVIEPVRRNGVEIALGEAEKKRRTLCGRVSDDGAIAAALPFS
jgi:hypothetical protein